IEALAMGRPVIVTRTGAIPAELDVEQAGCGVHIPASDPNALVLPARSMVQNFIVVEAAPPKKQDKLVRVTAGAVFDVAVDMRPDSPTYGTWVGEILSAENRRQLWIPAGLAHGFLVVSDTAEFLYKTTDFYAPQHELCIRWDDPTLKIAWPLDGRQPTLSGKDTKGQLFLDTKM
ncbi:MAG: dTDP-4-dehydrorhamnose 3,5-epimerase, partial [Betaproteobacteria bacterium]|nr:dTDP-4-dehydrorhamnose 3,5-epimerase [Betaproteobacteria bacterium]